MWCAFHYTRCVGLKSGNSSGSAHKTMSIHLDRCRYCTLVQRPAARCSSDAGSMFFTVEPACLRGRSQRRVPWARVKRVEGLNPCETVGNMGIAFRTRVRLFVEPTTVTGVPMWTRWKNWTARSRGMRTHPWEAG